jgi:hypothetical protein
MTGAREMTWRILIFVVLFAALGSPCHADVGLPMLAYYLPPAWLLLAPVIGVEALVAIWRFAVPARLAIRGATIANVLSTLIGVPLAWSLAAALELRLFAPWWNTRDPSCVLLATVQALWILPPIRACAWVFPVAAVLATTLFYAMSVGIEGFILAWVAPAVSARSRWGWSVWGNAASYSLLILATWPLQMPAFGWVWDAFNRFVEPFMAVALFLGLVHAR